MARKAVNGYPEKSYYDNTRFSGVVATSDPLNEGSFALLTNFKIADTGMSLVPRDGFTSTTFTVAGAELILSDKVLTYRDPTIQKDVVLDLAKCTADSVPFAYLTDLTHYNLTDNLLPDAQVISGYDTTDVTNFVLENVVGAAALTNKLAHVLSRSVITGPVQLEPVRDKNGSLYYVTRLTYTNEAKDTVKYWLKVLYRLNTTTVGGVVYTGDTLVLSVINMRAQDVNFVSRNIASDISIIPDPLRTQEVVDVVNSITTDVNRPVLLKINSLYATTKIPISSKTTMDVGVAPTFHLQDPKRLVGGTNAKWAYRFKITNTSVKDGSITYATPWRHLPVGNTMTNQTGVENTVINNLYLSTENNNDVVYTYYMIADKPHSWLQTLTATSYVTVEGAEAALYYRMVENGVSGSSGTALSNLAFAYLKLKTITDTLSPSSIALSEVDSTLYNAMDFRFVTQDSMASAIFAGTDLDEYTSRTAAFTSGEVAGQPGVTYAGITTDTVSAPVMPMTYASYNALPKMNFEAFRADALKKVGSYKIRIVFIPYSYRHAGTVASVPTDNVYLCSLGGLVVSGLRAYPTHALGDHPAYSDVVSVIKTFKFASTSPLTRYVDIFSNLGNLNFKDTLNVIPRECFEQGIFMKLLLKPYNDEMLADYVDATTQEKETYNLAWDSSAFTQSSVGVWMNDRDVVYIDEVDEANPEAIKNAEGHTVFEDRLVAWNGNQVFISEEGDYYYFTKTLKKTFPEAVLKVLPFKTILLVFTTQNLYAIYRTEIDTFTGNYTTQGTPEYALTTVWLQQPVLYNINPEKKYLDIIRVYNQMILFYSNEGQLYMIKPSATIDSETQFAIQYFNKSANSILANYEQYINERLRAYNKLDVEDPEDYVTKDDVTVTGLIDIDLIKIFYTVPGRITFVLIYDVVNNRYTTYDTLSFSDVVNARHVEGGECYLTRHGTNTYFTFPKPSFNAVDLNADMHIARMFRKEPIFMLLDTGNLNLNNHIMKRTRDLRIVLKNLDSTKILYNAELLLDDNIIRPFYAPDFIVRMLNGPTSLVSVNRVPTEDLNELFGMDQTIGQEGARTDLNSYYLYNDEDFYTRNSLLKTETLNSNRLIEYNSSILGVGKVIRLRLQFISKGKFKLQSFGIIYKERHV